MTKMKEVVPKMARRRGSDAGQSRFQKEVSQILQRVSAGAVRKILPFSTNEFAELTS